MPLNPPPPWNRKRPFHASGSATADTGWTPQFLLVERGGELVAACPLYLKDHSYGEYVFDWAWADAYRRHALRYYPKLLAAVAVLVALAVAVDVEAADHLRAGHGLFPDSGVDGLALPGHVLRHPDVDRQQHRGPVPSPGNTASCR